MVQAEVPELAEVAALAADLALVVVGPGLAEEAAVAALGLAAGAELVVAEMRHLASG